MTERPITPKQMYDIKERNYGWESFKYMLPKKYTHQSNSNIKSGALFCNKKNYLDDLQKQKKKIPGPSHYKQTDLPLRPKSGKMDRAKRKTLSEEVKQNSQKQNIPGPGAYFKRPNSAVTYSSRLARQKSQLERDHYLNEIQYLGVSSPGVGAYNLSQPAHVPGPKLLKKLSRNAIKSNNKQNESNQKILNTTECVPGTFAWMKSKEKKKDSNYFGRSKRFVTQSRYQRKPSPNSYKLNNNWLSSKNHINITHSTNFKSVYYH